MYLLYITYFFVNNIIRFLSGAYTYEFFITHMFQALKALIYDYGYSCKINYLTICD